MSDEYAQLLEEKSELNNHYKDNIDLLEKIHKSLQVQYSSEKLDLLNKVLGQIEYVRAALEQIDETIIDRTVDEYIELTLEELGSINNSKEESILRRRKQYLKDLQDDFSKKRKSLIDAGAHLLKAQQEIDTRHDDVDFRNSMFADTMARLDAISKKIAETEEQYRSDNVLEARLLLETFLKTKGKTNSPYFPYIAMLARYLSREGLTKKEAWRKVDPKSNEIEGLSWELWNTYWDRYAKNLSPKLKRLHK